MRGPVHYQVRQIRDIIFKEGVSKKDRVDPTSKDYGCIASHSTKTSYMSVWENFGHYLREFWNLKDLEMIESKHVAAYLEYKIEYYPSKLYAAKLSSAIGKLEFALKKFSKQKYGETRPYDFSCRLEILNRARKLDLVADNYHNRTYPDPELLISALPQETYRLAARIQLEGGARSEGVTMIKIEQLRGISFDEITNSAVGIIKTKEKGGKVGDVMMKVETYRELEQYIAKHQRFHVVYKKYADAIRTTAQAIGQPTEGTHGLRWNFAQRRIIEFQQFGLSYDEALQRVSYEMKHFRASISEHYL